MQIFKQDSMRAAICVWNVYMHLCIAGISTERRVRAEPADILMPEPIHSALLLSCGIVTLSLVQMRLLVFPRVGCWVLYISIYLTIFGMVLLGLMLLGIGMLLHHLLPESAHKDLVYYGLVAMASTLTFAGHLLLKARSLSPFQSFMRHFLQSSFRKRVGDTLPPYPSADPRRLAYRAVWDDAFGDDVRFGSVQGWGVRACCNRLRMIKHNK